MKQASEQIAGQTDVNYFNHNKIKEFEDVGYFLTTYVVSGGVVTKNVTRNDTVDVTKIVVVLDDDVLARDGTSFRTRTPNTIYYLDFTKGDFTFGTSHPTGVVNVDYLRVATITTDSNGNIATITDDATPRGGFRLKDTISLRIPYYDAQLTSEAQQRQTADSSLAAAIATKAPQTALDITNATKADIAYVDTVVQSIASGAPKAIFATLTALQTAFPDGDQNIYIVSENGNWYHWNGTSWASGGVYQSTGIAPESVTDELIAARNIDYLVHTKQVALTFKTRPKNLFDKGSVIPGINLLPDGTTELMGGARCSDYIKVTPNTEYRTLGNITNLHACDINKDFIASFGSPANEHFTTPINAHYVRFSMWHTEIDNAMLYSGPVSAYEPYFTDLKINGSEYLQDKSIETNLLSNDVYGLFQPKLSSPSSIVTDNLLSVKKKSRYKLIGDSITHGMGGTGFAQNGPLIPGTTDVYQNPDGYCWANLFRDYIAGYNGIKTIGCWENHINYQGNVRDNVISDYHTSITFPNNSNVDGDKLLDFEFFGAYLGIDFIGAPNTGIIKISIDGGVPISIDTYRTTFGTYTHLIDTLDVTLHKVEIFNTYSKNVSATDYMFVFVGFKVVKTAEVINYGISGYTTYNTALIRSSLIDADDDVLIIQLGTNDRQQSDIITAHYLKELWIYGKSVNPEMEFIFMSANPTAEDYGTQTTNFNMQDIDRSITDLCYQLKTTHISNYQAFINYIDLTGKSIDDLLVDGLHPNDSGYKVMFKNILRQMGLPMVV